MNVTQVLGNTWVLEAEELIPFYRLPDNRCILLDSGLSEEREALEEALKRENLTVAGILCSHAHGDHCGNNQYFQRQYQVPIALTAPEAGMCSSITALKCYFLVLSPGTVERELSHMIHTPDVLIPARDGIFHFLEVPFEIVHTPGHSVGHIAVITPDHVCYTGDAMLSYEMLQAKLPHELDHRTAEESRRKLKQLHCERYVMAHRGICDFEDMQRLIQANQELMQCRTQEILELITHPMTFSEMNERVCTHYQLFTKVPRRALRFERNIRFFLEYLLDQGRVQTECRNGTVLYSKTS